MNRDAPDDLLPPAVERPAQYEVEADVARRSQWSIRTMVEMTVWAAVYALLIRTTWWSIGLFGSLVVNLATIRFLRLGNVLPMLPAQACGVLAAAINSAVWFGLRAARTDSDLLLVVVMAGIYSGLVIGAVGSVWYWLASELIERRASIWRSAASIHSALAGGSLLFFSLLELAQLYLLTAPRPDTFRASLFFFAGVAGLLGGILLLPRREQGPTSAGRGVSR